MESPKTGILLLALLALATASGGLLGWNLGPPPVETSSTQPVSEMPGDIPCPACPGDAPASLKAPGE